MNFSNSGVGWRSGLGRKGEVPGQFNVKMPRRSTRHHHGLRRSVRSMQVFAVSCLVAAGSWTAGLGNAEPAVEEEVVFWPGFRGKGNSTTMAENLPLAWSGKKGVAWRTRLEGFGQSSPVRSYGENKSMSPVREGTGRSIFILSALILFRGNGSGSGRLQRRNRSKR